MEHDIQNVNRRRVLGLFTSCVTIAANSILTPFPVFAARSAIERASNTFRFDLILDEEKIGTHQITIGRVGISDIWRHETNVSASVSLGIFGDITFDHHSIEDWKHGRLQKLTSETDDDGEKFSVTGRADGDNFITNGPDGTFRASGDLMTTNDVWTETFCRQQEVIDAATGGVIGIVADPAGQRTARDALKHGLRPYDVVSAKITGQLLYDDTGIWTGGTLQKNGQEIEYDQRR